MPSLHHHPATLCVHAGAEANDPGQGVNTPIYTSSAFGYLDTEENRYPRYYNTPNQRTVVEKLCALEQGEAGLLFGSGMAAISTTMLALLQSGDHIVLQNDLYGGTYHFITTDLNRLGIAYTLVDTPDAASLEAALTTQYAGDLRRNSIQPPAQNHRFTSSSPGGDERTVWYRLSTIRSLRPSTRTLLRWVSTWSSIAAPSTWAAIVTSASGRW